MKIATLAAKKTASTLALTLALIGGSAVAHAQYGPPQGGPPPGGGYGQDRGGYGQDRSGWDAPPQEYRDVQRQGFHDGIEGARKDFENHRRPNVNNRDEFRHPNVPRNLRHDYRDGFRRGYNVGVQHMYGGGGGPRPF